MTPEDWLACADLAQMLAWLTEMTDGYPVGQAIQPVYGRRPSDRKLRLWACACCRHPAVWPLLTDPRSRNAVEVAERYADGACSLAELDDVETAAHTAWGAALHAKSNAAGMARYCCIPDMDYGARRMVTPGLQSVDPAAQASILRSIVNPYAPPLPAEVRTPLVVRLAEGAYEERVDLRCQTCLGTGDRSPGTAWHHYDRRSKDDDCVKCGGSGRSAYSVLDPQRLAVLHDALLEAGLPEAVDCPGCVGILQPDRGGLWPCRKCGAASWEERGRTPHPLLAALREQTPRWRGFWVVDQVLGRE